MLKLDDINRFKELSDELNKETVQLLNINNELKNFPDKGEVALLIKLNSYSCKTVSFNLIDSEIKEAFQTFIQALEKHTNKYIGKYSEQISEILK